MAHQGRLTLLMHEANHPPGYEDFLRDLKDRIRTAQVRAALAVNSELLTFYWQTGRDILIRQQQQGWGRKVIERLSWDLRRAFPDMKGFSLSNLHYMRAFAAAYPDERILQQLAGKLPWFHNCVLLNKVKEPTEREWYARQTLQYGWSRAVLVHQIQSGLYRRQGKALTNFERTLPAPQSALAHQLLKDPYSFDFLTLGPDAHERDLQRGLLDHLRDFLLELGVGFAFVGSQYRLAVGGQDYALDLLFYHLRLRCFVVFDLKMTDFQPEYAGKMNFYLSAVDDLLRHPDDQPSIGIILCRSQNRVVVEYTLRDTQKPIGVSGYRVTEVLPEQLKDSLPTIEELEKELSAAPAEGRNT